MKWLLILLLCVPAFADDLPDSAYGDVKLSPFQKLQVRKEATKRLGEIEADLKRGELFSFAARTDAFTDRIVARGVQKLKDAGDTDGAYWIETMQREVYSGFLTRMMQSRDIGDHPTEVLSTWLKTVTDHMTEVLGASVMKATHLSDLITINDTVRIVFSPCTFPMDLVTGSRQDEYKRHFARGQTWMGLFPVVVYWSADLPCLIGTAGSRRSSLRTRLDNR